MKKEELALYETPMIAEFISNHLLQNTIAKYIAWKVNRKVKRMNLRKEREVYLRNKGLII